jgi:hypothetical protein
MSNANKAERVLRSSTITITTAFTSVVWAHTVTYPARRIRVVTTANTWLIISDGASPTASSAGANCILLPPSSISYFAVAGNESIAAYSTTAATSVNITELTH